MHERTFIPVSENVLFTYITTYQSVYMCLCASVHAQVIEVKFEKLDLELDTYCRYDYVALFNGGETDDSRRIGKFCGDMVPE